MALFWPCPRRTLQHYAFRDDDLRPSKTRGIQIHCLAGHRSRRLVHNSEGRNNVRELHARMRLLGDSTIIECAREDTTPPRANFPVDSLETRTVLGKKKKKSPSYIRVYGKSSRRDFSRATFFVLCGLQGMCPLKACFGQNRLRNSSRGGCGVLSLILL